MLKSVKCTEWGRNGIQVRLGPEFKDSLKNFFTEVQYTYNAHTVSVELDEFLQTVDTCIASTQIKEQNIAEVRAPQKYSLCP